MDLHSHRRWVTSTMGVALVLFVAWSTSMMLTSPSRPIPRPCREDELPLARRLQAHVNALVTLGPRAPNRLFALNAASRYIQVQLRDAGTQVTTCPFTCDGVSLENIQGTLPGRHPDAAPVIVGAHYDTVANSVGADDNASGVAGLLELARLLRGASLHRPVRLVAFANEEAGGSKMGSWFYAEACRHRGEQIRAMLSLEMLGYYTSAPHSQRYPLASLEAVYPDRGDFIAFVGDTASGDLVREAADAFRRTGRFPSQSLSAPRLVHDTGRSDHASFWAFGYAALMVTDTANFRYDHYHQATDTPDHLDYASMAAVVAGLAGTIREMASSN